MLYVVSGGNNSQYVFPAEHFGQSVCLPRSLDGIKPIGHAHHYFVIELYAIDCLINIGVRLLVLNQLLQVITNVIFIEALQFLFEVVVYKSLKTTDVGLGSIKSISL